jgi:hypothetical protein
LIKVYSKLDGNLIAQVQRSQIPIHRIQATGYIQPFA